MEFKTNDNDMAESQNRPLSRRNFLQLSATAIGTAILAACGIKTSPTEDTKPWPSPVVYEPSAPDTQTPPTEIKGPVPGEYSQFMKDKQLTPAVFTDYDMPETRIQMAIDYLKRYRDALKNQPELRGQPLTTYSINTLDNFPISIPNRLRDPANDWTIYDVVNTFVIELENSKTTVVYDSTYPKLAGTVNSFELQNGQWVRKTRVILGGELMKTTLYHETNSNFYTHPTDVETAISLVHEYAHALQDEMILAYLNNNPTTLEQVDSDSSQVASWISQKVDEKNNEMRGQFSISMNILVKFNEAQANAIAHLFLYSLNQLNQSQHFPGTRRIDPFKIDVSAIQEQNADLHYINLYDLFLTEVINNQNALSAVWLIEAGQ